MNIQKITIYSAAILLNYYDNNIEPFLENCHDDILWLGPARDQMIRGRDNLINAFQKEEHELRFAVSDLVVYPLSAGSSSSLDVLLTFQVDTFWPDGSSNRVDQRISLSWIMQNNIPRIRLCHISNAIAYDTRDTIYPVHYAETYKSMVLSGQIKLRRVAFHGKDRSMIYLKPDQILYAESCGSHTLLHTSTQTFECVERLSALCKRCEPELIRCHESYLVNLTYVASIQRFSFTLTNGISIPIPEKRYTHVKKLLTNFSSSPEVKE